MPELLLSLDVGTTSLRAGLFTPAGDLVGMAATRLSVRAPAPGLLEQDAEAIWRTARRAVDRVLQSVGRKPADLAAIGVTSQRTSAVLWNRRTGRAASPLVLWSDLRGVEAAKALRQAGFMSAPQQAAAKLQAMVAANGAPASELAWGNVDSWLIHRLSGGAVHATDRSQAWPTAYLDLGTMGWNAALIAHQGLDDLAFPALVDTWGVMGHAAGRVLGAEVPIAADVADQQSALIAHGGQAKVTYGTSAALDVGTGPQLVFQSPQIPPFVLSSVHGETSFCLEGMVYSAGSALDWLRAAARLGGHARFEAMAASAADTGGAWFLPAHQGLGAPYGDASRRGGLGGLTLATSPAQIARAGLEGLAFRVREVLDAVGPMLPAGPPETLGVDGGLSANDTFLQIQADLLGRPIRRHALREATAAGAALCAARGVGLLGPAEGGGFTRYDRSFEPAIGADASAERLAAWQAAAHGRA
ncbi:FGGY-family carbohydrate kinase [Caulobacter sp. KR2-114]|uniref:FGGY-family carbohydrate kinase n=1 Tax=Caulobacter sp. KR2-114 TaxID=3400912 RepID=UPI003C0D311F